MAFPRLQRSLTKLIVVTVFTALAAGQDKDPSQPDIAQQAEANPGRPTVSTPATLTPVGYLQFETGVLGAEKSGEFANRTGIESVVKLSVARSLEFLIQTEPMVFSDLGPQNDR